MSTLRPDGRTAEQLRPIKIARRFLGAAPGRVLIQSGKTSVLCTASIDASLPPWKAAAVTDPSQLTGWLTAEYSMLPGSTAPRKRRERDKLDGRSTEIQRLIGRSLRAVADLGALGERSILVDCDVLEADGGTRTASITGAFIALVDCILSVQKELPDPAKFPLTGSVAAISAGIVDGKPTLDLDYSQDVEADVDMNVVLTGSGRFIEIQGTGEEATFTDDELATLLKLAKSGIKQLTEIQRKSLGKHWPFA